MFFVDPTNNFMVSMGKRDRIQGMNLCVVAQGGF
jgi:hypothetical protein